MASITVEIVSKTTSEAGTTFVLAASEEEIKRAGFVPYFIDMYFQGCTSRSKVNKFGTVTPYGAVVITPQVKAIPVLILPFVPALTDGGINLNWIDINAWQSYKLEKTEEKPNGTYVNNYVTPTMNVGDTLVFYDKKPADPA